MTAYNRIDLVGQSFGNLLVIGPIEARPGGSYWRCQCSCGELKYIARSSLVSGKSKSCGCKRGLAPNRYKIKHYVGVSTLKNMKTRCYNPACPDYKYYGARGIIICKEWLEDSYAFYEWFDNHCIKYLTLDRINTNGPYSPDNCKFSTASEQAINRRPWSKHDK